MNLVLVVADYFYYNTFLVSGKLLGYIVIVGYKAIVTATLTKKHSDMMVKVHMHKQSKQFYPNDKILSAPEQMN